MGRETETVDSGKRDREAEKRSAARAPQICENLWPDLRVAMRRGRKSQDVQIEDQAVHFPLVGKIQQVLKREDGGAALAAIW